MNGTINLQQKAENDGTKTWFYRHRSQALLDEFQSWQPIFRDLRDNILTRHGRNLEGSADTKPSDGTRKEQKLVSGEALFSVDVYKNGLKSGLTPHSQEWFKLEVDDEELMKRRDVKDWLFNTEKTMRTVFERSNFYTSIENVYLELIVFSTTCLIMEEDFEEVVNFIPLTIGEFQFDTDSKGRPIALYRRFSLEVHQMVDRFGYENLSDQAKQCYDNNNYSERFDIQHVITLNKQRDYAKKTKEGMEYKSCYYEIDNIDKNQFLSEDGIRVKNFIIPRDMVVSNDKYGFGRGMMALGDIKKFYAMMEDFEEAFSKVSRPPVVGDSDSVTKEMVDDTPSGFTSVKFINGKPQLVPLYAANSPIMELLESMNQQIKRIGRYFYNDFFLAVLGQEREATAYEISKRIEEKNAQVGSFIENFQYHLEAIINRVFDIMLHTGVSPLRPFGLIDVPPEELSGMPLKIKYVGLLSQALEMSKTSSIVQYTNYTLQLAQFDPEGTRMKFDTMGNMEAMAKALGVPPESNRSDEEIAAIQQQAIQAANMQKMAEYMKPMAESAKLASETKPDGEDSEDNLLQRLMGGMRQ